MLKQGRSPWGWRGALSSGLGPLGAFDDGRMGEDLVEVPEAVGLLAALRLRGSMGGGAGMVSVPED